MSSIIQVNEAAVLLIQNCLPTKDDKVVLLSTEAVMDTAKLYEELADVVR